MIVVIMKDKNTVEDQELDHTIEEIKKITTKNLDPHQNMMKRTVANLQLQLTIRIPETKLDQRNTTMAVVKLDKKEVEIITAEKKKVGAEESIMVAKT